MNEQKKLTKQVRVPLRWHRVLKIEAINRGKPMTLLLDELFKKVFGEDASAEVIKYDEKD